LKKLTKVRLINWHFFGNETLNIRNNTLITGQNATGKSTIVDAIAFILTAGDQIFNLAANEKSKRDLRGYVKCKLGIDNQEYLRVGDVTGHVALEFMDEKTKSFFVVGAVIDVFGDVLPPKALFYSVDGPMHEKLFVDDEGRILTTLNFKKLKRATEVYPTRREAKLAFRQKFGSINETYFSLLPKALAFKPIADVKEFIYRYLLEEKTLDVESIKESIHAYRDLEVTLKLIKQKVTDLEDMKLTYEEIKKNQDTKRFYEYLLKLIDLENTKTIVSAKLSDLEKNKYAVERYKKEIDGVENSIAAAEDRSKDIYAMMQSDETFKAGELFDREILDLTGKVEDQREIRRAFLDRVGRLKPTVTELREDFKDKIYDELAKLDLVNVSAVDVDKTRLALYDIEKRLREKVEAGSKAVGKAEGDRKVALAEINEIFAALKDLENNRLRYHPALVELQNRIKEGIRNRFGIDASVHVLAELLEVTDPKWADTVEDYLGGQRFNLIVEPRYFDEALQIYNRLKDQTNLSGFGLVNTKKIAHFINNQPSSLATIIATDNVDAAHYVTMTCGSLIMVQDVKDLENHPQAITREGVVYRSFTVRSLNKNTEKPFIGKRAHEAQLEKWKNLAVQARAKYNALNDEITKITNENILIGRLGFKDLIDQIGSGVVLASLEKSLGNAKDRKADLPTATVNELRLEYEKIKDDVRALNNQRRRLFEETGKLRSDAIKINEDLVVLEGRQDGIRAELSRIAGDNLAMEENAADLFAREVASAKDPVKVEMEYRKKIEAELQNLKNLEDSLRQKQFRYTNSYNLGYPYGYEHMGYYLEELNKLVRSELVKYESKVREAREAAEKLFKEDFIAKLRNYIVSAQDEIAKINATLKVIHFGEDTYEFIFPKSKEYADYYDMVLSDESMRTGTEIFNYDFEMKYQRQLEELFINLAQDDLNSGGAINKFTDYRTYMDYDIRIQNSQGDVILYSKVFKEKSGGETQVPFYVATIASFVRVFTQASRGNVADAIGLILFDEVFDKMDTTRIKAMMEFIGQLPVQIILATPPQKMEVLQKFTETTIVTMRDGKAARAYEAVQKY